MGDHECFKKKKKICMDLPQYLVHVCDNILYFPQEQLDGIAIFMLSMFNNQVFTFSDKLLAVKSNTCLSYSKSYTNFIIVWI